MTPESLPELNTDAFHRAMAAALGLPIDGEPRVPARRAAMWDPLGSVEIEAAVEDDRARDAAEQAAPRAVAISAGSA